MKNYSTSTTTTTNNHKEDTTMKTITLQESHAIEAITTYIQTAYESKFAAEKLGNDMLIYSFADESFVFVYGGASLNWETADTIANYGLAALYDEENGCYASNIPGYALNLEAANTVFVNNTEINYTILILD